jgi:hypothetical protein
MAKILAAYRFSQATRASGDGSIAQMGKLYRERLGIDIRAAVRLWKKLNY